MISCTFENGNEGLLRHVVVHAILVQDGKILLEKRAAKLTNGGLLCLPGGFLNRDETAAAGALRELKEETGWDGEIISLFSIITRPDRPKEDRQNVALSFIVKPIKKAEQRDTESAEIIWMPLESLPPPEELAFDHRDIIETYRAHLKTPFQLPVLS